MNSALQTLPPWLKVLIYFILLGLCTVVAGAVPVLNDFLFFLVAAIVIATVFTGSLLKATVGSGFFPQRKEHLLQFAAGTTIGICMLIVTATLTFLLSGAGWQINRHPSLLFILLTFLACLWSAFVQEAVFRGFPFQVLLQRYRPWIAQLALAIPFGLMHINSSMPLQDILLIMLTTGLGSLLFGLAYIKTRNLMLPIGLHGGWNFAQALIPRTQPGNTSNSLIIVSGSDYSFLNVVVPYLLVICVVILLLSFYRPNTIKQ
jgi:membrane protease YdiL (CAAX protease family)